MTRSRWRGSLAVLVLSLAGCGETASDPPAEPPSAPPAPAAPPKALATGGRARIPKPAPLNTLKTVD